MARVKHTSVVARQLPEHIREDYPTFVAFVEAYYEYLQDQGVDFSTIRDIDNTLESFVVQFKKELAYNLPNVVEDERFLLSRIKDQYLAKGSEASYKLLFKLLYGKNVQLAYPGRSMLIASDGRWNQEISLFAQVDYGDADDVVGKLVDIQTAGRILRVLVDKKEQLVGEVDRIVKIGKSYEIASTGNAGDSFVTVVSNAGIEPGQLVTAPQNGGGIDVGAKVISVVGNIVNLSKPNVGPVNSSLIFSNELYEFFLDKKFFGVVKPGDLIKYKDEFQARIVPATRDLIVTQPGKNFKVGQVFELRSGAGTGALMKVTGVSNTGGIKYAEFIKFGLGYTADFALSILATNDVVSSSAINVAGSSTLVKYNTYESGGAGTLSASTTSTTVTGSSSNFGQVGGVQVGDELWTTTATQEVIGVVKSIESATSLTLCDVPTVHDLGITSNYTGSYVYRNPRNVGTPYAGNPGGEQSIILKPTISDRTLGFDEQGYINMGDYVDYQYIDVTYAGTIVREFSLSYRNAQTDSDEPAVVFIGLGALVRYPGFFETNNGFLSDSIFIQDSRYYQAFSYVIKIDERLASYKSAVKTMLHPAGMALFGEFQITNNYDLSLELESLVKSLGIGLQDEYIVSEDGIYWTLTKGFSDEIDQTADLLRHTTTKSVSDSISETDSAVKLFGKLINNTSVNYNGSVELERVVMTHNTEVKNFGKLLTTSYSGMADAISYFNISKSLSDNPVISENAAKRTDKYLQTSTTGFSQYGEVALNPYAGQDFFIEDYNSYTSSTIS